MEIHRADVQLLRYRCRNVSMATSTVINWDPTNEGSYLHLYFNAGSVTATVNIAFPTVPPLNWPSGAYLRVVAEIGFSGAAITWDSDCKFQTAGDALPSPSWVPTSFTMWEGFYIWDNPGIILMTKLGEWT